MIVFSPNSSISPKTNIFSPFVFILLNLSIASFTDSGLALYESSMISKLFLKNLSPLPIGRMKVFKALTILVLVIFKNNEILIVDNKLFLRCVSE